jgi:hypothetical protein
VRALNGRSCDGGQLISEPPRRFWTEADFGPRFGSD